MPAPETTPALDVTQAYRTVQARLTEALKSTPSPFTATLSTEKTSQPESPLLSPSPLPINSTGTSALDQSCDQAFAGVPLDITIPDDTQLQPGQPFTKVWRLQNAGTCTWTQEYAAVWFSGEPMGSPTFVSLNTNVSPGQIVDITVDMVAPDTAGSYQSNWKLRNADGKLFGIGPNAGSPFWVRIVVTENSTATPTPTPSATVTPEIQVSGFVTLVHGDKLDLDTSQVNAGSIDLIYWTKTGEEIDPRFLPQGIALLGLFGQEQPSMSDCQAANLSDNLFRIGKLSLGTFLCYRTDLGLPGWVRLDAIDPDDQTLSMEILTWSLP